MRKRLVCRHFRSTRSPRAGTLCLKRAAAWIAGAKEYYLQQFKDSGDILAGQGLGAYSDGEMRELLGEVRRVLPCAQLRGVAEENGNEPMI